MGRGFRCSSCRDYFPRDSFYWRDSLRGVCSEECLLALRAGRRETKGKKVARRRVPEVPVATLDVRLKVKARDHDACRWCGASAIHVHHIRYRSEGGPDEESNLICLCERCHSVVHSRKRLYQPILLATVWLGYTGGQATVLDAMRYLERQDWYERPKERVSA